MTVKIGLPLTRLRQWFDRFRFRLRERLVKYVTAHDGQHDHTFRCGTPGEVWRAKTLPVKEEGTVHWIRQDVRSGDVFYDIGANIGLYTLVAGKRVGKDGAVYAFEPHVGNLHSLLDNVRLNKLQSRIHVLSCALHDTSGFFAFNYKSPTPASSQSQLGSTLDDSEKEFRPCFTELKYATSIDKLVEDGVIRPANLIKIDVDGNELLVLKGMERLLTGPQPPRAVQIEINRRHKEALLRFMCDRGYDLAARHDTQMGKEKIAAGHDPETVAHNAIFRPRER